MSDIDLAITLELEQLFPVSGSPDWDAVVSAARVGRTSQKRWRWPRLRRALGRRRMAVVAAVAVLAFAAAAVAAVRVAPWWQGGEPPVDPQAVASVARDNMPANVRVTQARTVVTAGDAALVAIPLDQTGYCLIPALDGHASFGASCVYQVAHPQKGDSDSARTATRARSAKAPARWIAYGRITDPRARKLDLGAFTVELATGGFFLAQVPDAEWSTLNGTANRGAILDGSDNVLRRGCVNWGASPDAGRPQGFSRSATALWMDQPSGECKPQTLPPIPTIDLNHGRTLFEVTLTKPFSIWKAGEQIRFEEAPASDGTTCVIPIGPRTPRELYNHGCVGTRIAQLRTGLPPISTEIGAGLSHEDGKAFYAWDVTGSTNPSAKIAKLTLSSPSASAEVAYGDNFFFAQLPVTTPGPRVGSVPFPDGPWTLTGYDAAGHEVAQVDLNELHHQASPH